MAESEKRKDKVEKSSRRPPPPPPSATSGRTRKYWGYIARIVFVVVVAVCFNYRNTIKASFTRLTSGKPDSEAEPTAPMDPLKVPEPDYYNPQFDPANPPEPIYSKSGVRMITKNELAAHAHSGPLKPLWLAIMGKVFDVEKGRADYYGPKGGYNFFTGEKIWGIRFITLLRLLFIVTFLFIFF